MPTLREYMQQEQPDPTEPEDFYYPCASDTPKERQQHAAAHRRDADAAEVAFE